MQIKGKVVLVTGANRGLGKQFAKSLVERGAAKVYAAARNPDTVDIPGVEVIKLDVTNPVDIAAAARHLTDVDVIINNAGAIIRGALIDPTTTQSVRELFEVNAIGPLALAQAFAPTLKRNGGGALVNVLSVLSWFAMSNGGAYSVSKSAAWGVTNGLRAELKEQGTLVVAVHPGYIDTDMTNGIDAPKTTPAHVVSEVLDAIERDQEEVLVDDTGRAVKQSLSTAAPIYLTGIPR
jgi:NAD(P)-dependent dehydrogenase (short-subunit alcohol dehydrogenase family)